MALDLFESAKKAGDDLALRASGHDLPSWFELHQHQLVQIGAAVAVVGAVILIAVYRRQIADGALTGLAWGVVGWRKAGAGLAALKAIILDRARNL